MVKRKAFLLMGVGVSIVSGGCFLIAVAAVTLASSALPTAILLQLPSIVIVGYLIALVADSLKVGLLSLGFGAALGWIAGAAGSTYLFAALRLEVNQFLTQILFFIVQVVFGTAIGSIPAVIARRLRRRP
jgi:hypothetical protein